MADDYATWHNATTPFEVANMYEFAWSEFFIAFFSPAQFTRQQPRGNCAAEMINKNDKLNNIK